MRLLTNEEVYMRITESVDELFEYIKNTEFYLDKNKEEVKRIDEKIKLYEELELKPLCFLHNRKMNDILKSESVESKDDLLSLKTETNDSIDRFSKFMSLDMVTKLMSMNDWHLSGALNRASMNIFLGIPHEYKHAKVSIVDLGSKSIDAYTYAHGMRTVITPMSTLARLEWGVDPIVCNSSIISYRRGKFIGDDLEKTKENLVNSLDFSDDIYEESTATIDFLTYKKSEIIDEINALTYDDLLEYSLEMEYLQLERNKVVENYYDKDVSKEVLESESMPEKRARHKSLVKDRISSKDFFQLFLLEE